MEPEFVIAKCDIYCNWTGPYPRYRCYVNNELFTERTWIWRDCYLEENLQIMAPPGMYTVKVELLDTEHAKIKMRNLRIETGPAVIIPSGQIQIYTPEKTNANT
jgi:hypothetical protein